MLVRGKIYACNVAQGFYDSYFRKCISKGCHPKSIGEYSLLHLPSLSLFIHATNTHAQSHLFLPPAAMAYSSMHCKDIPFTDEDTKVDRVFFPDD